MTKPQVAPYGSWKSPITSDLIASGTIRLEQIALDGENIYWIEMRPAEGGRCVIVRRSPDGQTVDTTPFPFNARMLEACRDRLPLLENCAMQIWS